MPMPIPTRAVRRCGVLLVRRGWLPFLREPGVIHERAILTDVAVVGAIPTTNVGIVDKKRMREAGKATVG